VPGAAPWFWTDQFGGNLQMLGYPNPLHEVVVRGSLDDDSWCVFMLDGERIAAAYLWNAGRERSGVARFMNAGTPVSANLLADRERPLRNLLKVPS
jgi:3-phenylpropionate/trans-cinnamate dioxygenase ferredoxin reductase subunit